MDPKSRSALSLWRITAPGSLVECTLERISTWYELRVRQNEDVLVRQQFASRQAAVEYAEQLRDRLASRSKIVPDAGPDRKS